MDEEELAKLMKPVLEKTIYPESVVSLQASELFLKRKARALEKEVRSSLIFMYFNHFHNN